MIWITGSLIMIGHIGFWCLVFNRIHATAWPRWVRKLSERFIVLAVVAPIVWLSFYAWKSGVETPQRLLNWHWTRYWLIGCGLLGLLFTAQWLYRKLTFRLPAAVVECRIERFSMAPERGHIDRPKLLHGFLAKILGWIPFNESLSLSVQKMSFQLAVPKSLDGFKICQLSDLHFTGQIGIEYFQAIVAKANAFEPDLIVITGDLVDERECLDWLDSTVGRLQAKYGVYYVLGNHDLRIKNEPELRARLARLGLISTAGRWLFVEHNGVELAITGTERPWFPEVVAADESSTAALLSKCQLRILLSHSPDQLNWAKPFRFDLMFAGHTHGGQIAVPVVGPLVAPSKYGTRYASGTFQIGAMLMHVSRGISGDEPIRIGSPPELGLFTLRSKSSPDSSARTA